MASFIGWGPSSLNTQTHYALSLKRHLAESTKSGDIVTLRLPGLGPPPGQKVKTWTHRTHLTACVTVRDASRKPRADGYVFVSELQRCFRR